MPKDAKDLELHRTAVQVAVRQLQDAVDDAYRAGFQVELDLLPITAAGRRDPVPRLRAQVSPPE